MPWTDLEPFCTLISNTYLGTTTLLALLSRAYAFRRNELSGLKMTVYHLLVHLSVTFLIRDGLGEGLPFKCGVIRGPSSPEENEVSTSPSGNHITTTLSPCFVQDIGRSLADGETHIYQNCSTTVMCDQGILHVDQNAGCSPYYTCGVEGGVRGCYCNGSLECRLPYGCHDIGQGSMRSGVYTIQPRHWTGDPFEVYCDMEDDGGGWTDGETYIYQNCSTTVMCYQGILHVDQNAGCPPYYSCAVEGGVRGCYCNGSLECRLPYGCHEVGQGSMRSGVYTIQPRHWTEEPFEVYCDMENDGGKWTVFQRRVNGNQSFYQSWASYASGFGNLSNEFWLGNEKLHYITSQGDYELKVELVGGDSDTEYYAQYDSFEVESEMRNYKLSQLGSYEGTAGDSMSANHGYGFTTFDRDNDNTAHKNCGESWQGAWWYKNCGGVNPNGMFNLTSGWARVFWNGVPDPISRTQLKIRPFQTPPT